MSQAPVRKKRATPEADLQALIMKEIGKRCGEDVFAFAVPNGGYRSAAEATNHLKRMGVVAGVPDIAVIVRGRAYFLEVKSDTGRVSSRQSFTFRRISKAGAPTYVVNCLEHALEALEEWGAFPVIERKREAVLERF